MESRERDHFPRDLQPEGFLSFFELSKYVYIYMQYSLFLLLQQTIPLHKLEMEKSPTFLPFFFFILEWLLRQLSIGMPSVSRESNQALWWSHRFSLLVSLFLSLKSFPENNGKKTVSDVNICLKAWQKKDYHPSTIGCRWKLESFIFCTGFCGKTVKPII